MRLPITDFLLLTDILCRIRFRIYRRLLLKFWTKTMQLLYVFEPPLWAYVQHTLFILGSLESC